MSTEITPGTYAVTFPRGMHKADFSKCLTMARKHGTFDGASKTWAITVQGPQVAACVAEMAGRGAIVTEA